MKNSMKEDRARVFNKFGGCCAYCGCQLEKGWHCDHVEPCRRMYHDEQVEGEYRWIRKLVGFSNPDANHIDNLFPSCPSCNINKHGDTIDGFRNSIETYLRSLNKRNVQYKMSKKYGLVIETAKPVIFYFETFIKQTP